jgi:hypothetical protein
MKEVPYSIAVGQEHQPYHNDAYPRERLRAWLEYNYPHINGPIATHDEAGWPQFCKKPIEQWPKKVTTGIPPARLVEAKAALDKFRATDKGMIAYPDDKSSGGKRRKRTKFNKLKSSSRRLSKSRRRTHRK